ncbi:acetyl-CoA C-acetyltransferase [Paracoccus aminovorans]|uniref:Acetyl-CoA C-acetyltransferase n=2 Tax=Paracoccus aminovorans TaxID=34004 RepID=A0A1I2Z4C0_9RHOB|nr:thiolase family protein [Paracoccus aminovorans]CQR83974.1 Acetyl-CoA C-acetyltransferase [Paracoccus aminovorans]SFH32707.1 acetyl-CoA C-acetyltransferase [Paracoccus aminovorans]
MTGAVIVAARRSAVVPRGGAFRGLEIHQLAAPVIADLLRDAGLAPGAVDELILANALGAGGNPARVAALAAGLPQRVAGLGIDRQCCGGMDAVLLAEALIGSGRAQVVIAGGAESYSRRPLRLRTDPQGGPPAAYDQPPFTPWPDRDPGMAEAAEAVAAQLGISRARQDAWTIASHARALAARDRLRAEITAVAGVRDDPFARPMTPQLCARAKVLAGSVTAANTAAAADGAGFCLLVSETVARRLATPRLRILAGATLGADPALPGLAPVPAIRAALADSGTSPGDLDAVALMEAFAVQAIACAGETGLPEARINTGGGALARGHPIGASGAIETVRLFHDLTRPGQRGLAAIAAAGGLGSALVLERL